MKLIALAEPQCSFGFTKESLIRLLELIAESMLHVSETAKSSSQRTKLVERLCGEGKAVGEEHQRRRRIKANTGYSHK